MNAPRLAAERATATFGRFTPSFYQSTRACPHLLRQFSSSHPRSASPEKLQTTPSYQPYPLSRLPSSPRTDNIPEPPSANPTPMVYETRPPQQSTQNVAKALEPPPPQATATLEPEAAILKSAPAPDRKRKLRPRKAAMKLTPSAVEQLRTLLDAPEPKLIKVSVRNRGCSGLAYHLEYVDKAGAFDETVEQDGVKVLIDSKALFSIIGSEMDWVEDKLNQRFVFRNPNIKEECGCGESFMV